MNSNLNRVPPGFRFHPTDEELVDYYLRKKVANKRIDLDVIKDIDLYKIEPWDLQEKCKIGSEEQTEWYFFSHKDKKYPTGTRTNRATTAGFWKATGRDKAIYCKLSLIGMRKTLVFYKGRAPNGQKSDWIMHEYRLETNENATPQEEGWVVCRVFKKRITTQRKGMDGDSGCWYDEQMGLLPELESPKKLPPTLDQMMYHHHHLHHGHGHHQQQHNNHNYGCKQELDLHYHIPQDPFLHLPQLESPKMPSPYATSLNKNSNVTGECHIPYGGNTSGINGIGMESATTQTTTRPITSSSEEHQQQQHSQNNTNDDQVTDWRLLDKFVASQLSQEDVSKETAIANESLYPIPDMSVLLKQSANNNNTTTSNSKQQSDYTSNSNSDADLWSFTGKWD